MTVSTTSNSVTYPGTGVLAPMPIPFRYSAVDDMEFVSVSALGVQTILVRGVDYVVDGQTAMLTAPAAVGTSTRIKRTTPLRQPDSLRNLGALFPRTLEGMFDRATFQLQDLESRIGEGGEAGSNVLKFPPAASANGLLPMPVVPGSFLQVNPTADGIVYGTPAGGGGGDTDPNLRADLAGTTGAQGSKLVGHKHPDTNSLAQSIHAFLQNAIPVTAYATPAQCAIDATAATQMATAYAISTGKSAVYLPGGVVYRFAAASPSIDPGMGDMEYFGDGYSSQIIFEEGASVAGAAARKWLFRHDQDEVVKGNLSFRNLNFSGTWVEGGYAERGGGILFLNHYSQIRIIGCRFYNMSWMVTACEAIRNVIVEGNTFELCSRDMVRFRSSFNQRIIANTFRQCDDDAVALHQHDYLTGIKIREGIVITANVFEDCLGVKILAARMVTVANNIFRRCKVHAIQCLTDTAEGNTNQFGIDIHHNQCYDTLERAPFSTSASTVISVMGESRKGGSSTVTTVPGEYGEFFGWVKPWNHRNNAITTAAASLPPDFFIRITDNTIARTLPTVGTYEAWGYGRAARSNMALSNVAVTDTALRPDGGIVVSGNARKVLISGNTVSHVSTAIKVNEQASRYGHDGLVIRGNNLSDFNVAGVFLLDTGVLQYSTAVIENNEFDGDPYHENSARSANGTWTNGSAGSAILAPNCAGFIVSHNRFRNVRFPVFSNYSFVPINNVTYGDPAATFFSILNKGIGSYPPSGPGWIHIIEGSDPANSPSTYKVIQTIPLRESNAMPTTGKYVPGHFVANTGPFNNVYGWTRSTLGSAHVAGTDWKTVSAS